MAFILDLFSLQGVSKLLAVIQLFHISTMSLTIDKVTPSFELSEGPHWDVQSQKLYFVDIVAQKVMRLDPATGKVTSAYLKDGPVGVAVPVEGTKDKLIVGCGRNVVLLTWDGESDVTNPPVEKLLSLDTDRTDTRINDGKCDPAGRFWLGTMGNEVDGVVEPNKGSLYLVDKNVTLKNVLSPVSISNGLAWNSKNDVMYYIDSQSKQIWSFDYNNADGTISNKKIVFDLKKNDVGGLPDGMTIDADDNLWIALFHNSSVIQVDPKNGKLLKTVKLPAERITSVAFGGPQLDILYVTSAQVGMTADEKKTKPEAGSLFSVKGLGVRGRPAVNFKLSR